MQRLLHIHHNSKSDDTKNSGIPEGSGIVMKEKETVERERVKARLH